MAMMTLYAREQKRHRCIEESFGKEKTAIRNRPTKMNQQTRILK